MNRQLEILRAWATDRATEDPDLEARPLWGQIASEVDAYLDAGVTPGPLDVSFDLDMS